VVGPRGLVVAIDIDATTLDFARENLERAGYTDVVLIHGDGGLGYPEHAPYDRICVTAACADVPPPLIEQLAVRGRLIVPVMDGTRQRLTVLEKTARPALLAQEAGMMRFLLVALSACLVAAAPSAANQVRAANDPVAGSYIVVFKADTVRAATEARSQRPLVASTARALAQAHGGKVTHVYQHALTGFAVRLSADRAAALARNPRVAYVEPDQAVHAVATQSPATWGLDRIDQRDLPLNNSYTYNQTGSGVHAYIIDTGIRATHVEFTGRMGNGADFVGDGQGTNDCNGPGTHVAGTTGGTTYGVAKQVTLHAVRVLNCQGSGSTSGVIAGVDWVTNNSPTPAVANMSLGGGISTSLDNAVINSINSGVSYAVAAGNSNTNACNSSPARAAPANTVGATTSTDARSSFSNFGTCLDIFAPGSSITSAWNTSNTWLPSLSFSSLSMAE
jgi:subtilisin family serine protease